MMDQGPGGTCGPVEREAHAGAGLLAGLVSPWGTHAEALNEELKPTEALTLEKFMEDCLLWKGPYAGEGKGCEELPPAEEGEVETTCDELPTVPIFCPPGVEEVEKSAVKLSLGKRGEMGGKVV
ncbi:hypothetical protein BTVI_39872 [Pitangus sulphuratus]|nr:hypothetical protein BTVI_39872 [Pitangus sulphuratus]